MGAKLTWRFSPPAEAHRACSVASGTIEDDRRRDDARVGQMRGRKGPLRSDPRCSVGVRREVRQTKSSPRMRFHEAVAPCAARPSQSRSRAAREVAQSRRPRCRVVVPCARGVASCARGVELSRRAPVARGVELSRRSPLYVGRPPRRRRRSAPRHWSAERISLILVRSWHLTWSRRAISLQGARHRPGADRVAGSPRRRACAGPFFDAHAPGEPRATRRMTRAFALSCVDWRRFP